jgi:hypothetical protein
MRKLDEIQKDITDTQGKLKKMNAKSSIVGNKLRELFSEKRSLLREKLVGKFIHIIDSHGDGEYTEKYVKINDKSEEHPRELIANIFRIEHFGEDGKDTRYEISFNTSIHQIELDGLGNHKEITKDECYEALREFLMELNSQFGDENGGLLP